MADHAEEQEMEAEALEAIFESHFKIVDSHHWSIELYPEHAEEASHVSCRLLVEVPETYPEVPPILSVEIMTGLAEEHVTLLTELADAEAQNNEGVPCVFAVAEQLREWLRENNIKGLDDQSMHAQMMRKKVQEENEKLKQTSVVFEAQKQDQVILTEAEQEELTVRQRRAEGTPCNKENFEAWQQRFLAEMEANAALQLEELEANTKKSNEKETDKSGRMTGYDFFRSKAGGDLAALEAAAEEAEGQELDEDLFKDEDDVDLDDLDFDDDDDDDEEDDEEDLDI